MTDGKTVVVVGGRGTVGRAYIEALAAAGHNVWATIRPGDDPDPMLALGAHFVEADLATEDGADRALTDTDVVVVALAGSRPDLIGAEKLVTTHVVEAAARHRVGHIVYSSVLRAERYTGVPHFDVKGELERAVEHSGVPYTILRPCTFMEALDSHLIRSGVERFGMLMSPIGYDTPISYIATADVAKFAVRALDDDRLAGAALDLGGPRTETFASLVPIMAELVDHEVTYSRISLEPIESQLGPELVSMVRYFDEYGFSVDMGPVLERFPEQLEDAGAFLERSGWTSSLEKAA